MGKRKNRERDLEGVEEEEHAFFDSDEDVAKKAKKIRKLERKEAEKKKREEQEDSSSSDEDEKKHKKDKKERKEKDKKERKEKEDKKKDKKHKKRTPHESEESSPVVVDSILTPLEAIQTEASTSTTAASSSAPTTAVSSTSQGSYSPETKEWIWNISSDLRLRVGSFKGRPFVDIRHLWQDKPTKKGAFLPVHIFDQIQKWPHLQEALDKTK